MYFCLVMYIRNMYLEYFSCKSIVCLKSLVSFALNPYPNSLNSERNYLKSYSVNTNMKLQQKF